MLKAMDKDDHYAFNFSGLSSPSDEAVPGSGSGSHLYRAQLIAENRLYEQLLNRHQTAMMRLKEVTREANALQEENEWFRLANEELTRRLLSWSNGSGIKESGDLNINNVFGSSSSVIEMGREDMGGISSTSNSSATSVIMDETDDSERCSLPKSISIPSPGYFKLVNHPSSRSPPKSPQGGRPNTSRIRHLHLNGKKLRVRGEERAVEIQVFNQGTYKTELCNKWEETGTCSYGDHCRFAHGLAELRPVIRHPRYKTQLCRMVVAGATCPYGHRCHFRHSLPPPTTTTTTISRLSSLS